MPKIQKIVEKGEMFKVYLVGVKKPICVFKNKFKNLESLAREIERITVRQSQLAAEEKNKIKEEFENGSK